MDNSLRRDVLIVSATPLIRELFHDVFIIAHYECLLAADGGEAIEKFRRSRPSLVVTDYNLPDVCGSQLLQDLRREDPDAAVIVVCGGVLKRRGTVIGFMDVDAVRRASLELGAYAVFEKPVDVEELVLTAERALATRQTRSERRQDNSSAPVGCPDDKRSVSPKAAPSSNPDLSVL